MAVALDPEHQPFVIAHEDKGACDIELDVSLGRRICNHLIRHLLLLPAGFGLLSWKSPARSSIFPAHRLGLAPYKAAWFDPSFERGHVVLSRSSFHSKRARFFRWNIPSTSWRSCTGYRKVRELNCMHLDL